MKVKIKGVRIVRIKEDFTATSAAEKREIVELSVQGQNTIYRVYETGSPNARIVLALAHVKNVTPYYYTGETDEKSECSEAIIKQFLSEHGYTDLVAELEKPPAVKQKRAYNRRKPKTEAEVENVSVVSDEVEDTKVDEVNTESEDDIDALIAHDIKIIEEHFADDQEMVSAIENLCEDEAIILLKALFIRAKAGGNAAVDLTDVKRRLLS